MKRFLITIALTSVLAVTAFAGEIPTGGLTAPPPPPPDDGTPTIGNPAPGEILSSGYEQQVSATALTMIQSILAACMS